jgi:hypothetical protein
MLFFRILIAFTFLFAPGAHPFYLSVTDMKYNGKNKTIEVACKLFTNDLETALKKLNNQSVDLIHPKDKKETEKILFGYISKRLSITLNGKNRNLKFIGYEKEDDVIWAFMEIEKCELPKQIVISNSLLYDFLKEQSNIVHFEVNGNKQSSRVVNPEKEIKFVVPI